MIDLDDVMTSLAAHRPMFHSEADFQHALAWEIHRRLPDASVRLELPHALPNRPIHLDLWVRHGDAALAVELKYPTRAFVADIGGEAFSLKNHAAQDILRYDFIKDIRRVEQVVAARDGVAGLSILLTNDPLIWRQRRDGSIDAQFHLWEGRTLGGTVAWAAHAGAGTTKGRETPLALRGMYELRWRDYSQPHPAQDVRFRYLAVRVDAGMLLTVAPGYEEGASVARKITAKTPSEQTVPPRAKYAALTDMLPAHSGNQVMVNLAAIGDAVGGLPDSAYQYREWWANHAGNPQARGWMDAGFTVETVDLPRKSIMFRRLAAR